MLKPTTNITMANQDSYNTTTEDGNVSDGELSIASTLIDDGYNGDIDFEPSLDDSAFEELHRQEELQSHSSPDGKVHDRLFQQSSTVHSAYDGESDNASVLSFISDDDAFYKEGNKGPARAMDDDIFSVGSLSHDDEAEEGSEWEDVVEEAETIAFQEWCDAEFGDVSSDADEVIDDGARTDGGDSSSDWEPPTKVPRWEAVSCRRQGLTLFVKVKKINTRASIKHNFCSLYYP
jgi:hypothetical protein